MKAGKTGPAHVRDLRGVLEREEKRGAVMAALQTLAPPTRDMIKEAAGVGFYRSPWGRHPKIQFLTAEDLLKGSGLDYPAPKQTNVSLRKAHPSARDVLQGTLPGVVKGESKKKATRKSKRRMS